MDILRRAAIWILMITAACETKWSNLDVDCDECYSDRFSQADIVVKINAFTDAEYIWLEVYKGKVDKGELIFADTALFTNEYFFVDVNEAYSARAVYHFEADSIIAIDGTTMRRRFVTDYCDADCYIADNKVIDLRLEGY